MLPRVLGLELQLELRACKLADDRVIGCAAQGGTSRFQRQSGVREGLMLLRRPARQHKQHGHLFS